MLPIVLPRAELGLDEDQAIEDMARAISAAATALFAHTVGHRALRRIAAAATVPLINGRSDQHRPCQALADLLTIRERFGSLEGLAIAFVGVGRDPTVHSLMEAGALAGMDVRICCPSEHRPDRLIELGAETFATMHGAHLTVTDDLRAAVEGVDVVYTKAWELDGRGLDRLREYQVGASVMKLASKGAIFMHCLPAVRGEEVSARVIDGRRSVVWEQAANRLPAEQAAIYSLVVAARTRERH
jgi:ornithine carbamoyltransferase